MKQLAQALRAAGFRPSSEVRAERDRAITALVKTRKAKRKGAKALKARVATLVTAMRVVTPIAIALLVLFAPSLAHAHPGHGNTPHMPEGSAGVVLVGLGVTLGAAIAAWEKWGKQWGQVPHLAPVTAGNAPSADEASERTVLLSERLESSYAADSAEQRAVDEGLLPRPYYSVRIPWAPYTHRSQWHPTEKTGPFSVLMSGAFVSLEAAREWADGHLRGNSYNVVFITFDLARDEEKRETVYTFDAFIDGPEWLRMPLVREDWEAIGTLIEEERARQVARKPEGNSRYSELTALGNRVSMLGENAPESSARNPSAAMQGKAHRPEGK